MDIIKLIDQTVTRRFGEYVEKLPHQIQWLSDQGPQYTCDQTRRYGTDWGFDARTTPAYSPESNGMAEAFVKLFKRDCVYANELIGKCVEHLKGEDTERWDPQLKGRRGLGQFLVRGLGKVTNVALMIAIGHNLVQHAASILG